MRKILPVKIFIFLLIMALLTGCRDGSGELQLGKTLSKDGVFIPGPKFSWGEDLDSVLDKLPHKEHFIRGTKEYESFRDPSFHKGFASLFAVDPAVFQGVDADFNIYYEFSDGTGMFPEPEERTGLYSVDYDTRYRYTREICMEILRQLLTELYELYPESSMGDSSHLERLEEEFLLESPNHVSFVDWLGEDGTILRVTSYNNTNNGEGLAQKAGEQNLFEEGAKYTCTLRITVGFTDDYRFRNSVYYSSEGQ